MYLNQKYVLMTNVIKILNRSLQSNIEPTFEGRINLY